MIILPKHIFSLLYATTLFFCFFSLCPAQEEAAATSQPATSDKQSTVRILLVAKNEATISSRFFGTIDKIYVEEGKSFNKGQPLIKFDCRELAAERNIVVQELKMHQTTRKANAELYAQKMVGELENDISRIKVAEARAKKDAFTAKMGNCAIKAPFSGQLVELKAHEHESLQPGTPIMLIQDPKSLEVQLHVPSLWLRWLKPGTLFSAEIEETGGNYTVKVDHIGVRVDPVSRTIKIYGSFLKPQPELLPGMSGYARFDHQ